MGMYMQSCPEYKAKKEKKKLNGAMKSIQRTNGTPIPSKRATSKKRDKSNGHHQKKSNGQLQLMK